MCDSLVINTRNNVGPLRPLQFVNNNDGVGRRARGHLKSHEFQSMGPCERARRLGVGRGGARVGGARSPEILKT